MIGEEECKINASFYPEMTEMLKKITNDISEKIIKEGSPIILVDEYSWYREVLSLMAKQINLCDSCLLLLENGMEQEAYLLARSQFNNMLWIKYLCYDDAENTRVKEYFYQPHINQILSCKNIKKMIEDYGTELDEQLVSEENIQKLNDCIAENSQILEDNSIIIRPKSISELSRQDALLFGLYITLYNEGSKFEHSDISKTKLYRKPAVEEYGTDQVFVFDLAKSDKGCWLTVFNYSLLSMFFAFDSIRTRICDKEEQLFWNTKLSKAAYKMDDFNRITFEFGVCQDMLDKAMKENEMPK